MFLTNKNYYTDFTAFVNSFFQGTRKNSAQPFSRAELAQHHYFFRANSFSAGTISSAQITTARMVLGTI